MTTMESSKTIPETLADLRKLFAKHSIEDWEPIPSDQDRSYSVRYRWAGQWLTVSSTIQATKDLNLRQCHQVIRYLLMWAERGVGGISQGVTFIHGGLATVDGAQHPENELHEAYATIGVDPAASIEEIHQVYRAKVKYGHPDLTQDPEEKLIRESRQQRLNIAYDLVNKARGEPNRRENDG